MTSNSEQIKNKYGLDLLENTSKQVSDYLIRCGVMVTPFREKQIEKIVNNALAQAHQSGIERGRDGLIYDLEMLLPKFRCKYCGGTKTDNNYTDDNPESYSNEYCVNCGSYFLEHFKEGILEALSTST